MGMTSTYYRIAVLTYVLLLVACAASPSRHTSITPKDVVLPEPSIEITQAPSPTLEHPEPELVSPWQRLRDRFVMGGCVDQPASVMRWAKRYTASPDHFSNSLDQAMPFFMLVLNELELRDLPGEFALLPYVESGYTPFTSRGNRPAGIWQFMPATARLQGLVVTSDYDERLDVQSSTQAALKLLSDYYQDFADWRLVDMAFNAGEYRVKKLLTQSSADPLSAAAIGRLKLSATTHEHLAKLMALACVVSEPQRFNVDLPEPNAEDALESVQLAASIDLRFAARLAGIEVAELRRLNPVYRSNRTPESASHKLLLPTARAANFRDLVTAIPVSLWRDWRETPLKKSATLRQLAMDAGVSIDTLAAANGVSNDATFSAGTRLLLPGRELVAKTASTSKKDAPHVHIVSAGDTLSGIAKRYGVRLAQLLNWNTLSKDATLHLGDRLRIDAPHIE